MRVHVTAALVMATAAGVFAAAQVAARPSALIVHEWGTFTSIAGEDGRAVTWIPQAGPTDLPCFVERGNNVKGFLSGTVRMETPVLYFYTPREETVSVKVAFRQGMITEWFPHALTNSTWQDGAFAGVASWNSVTVSPDLPPVFPVERGASHYYKARNTDAAPLRSGTQTERFLFYRGVGQFQPPISASVQPDGKTIVWTPGAPIGDVLMFENRRGTTAFGVHHVSESRATLERPSPEDAASTPQKELVRILAATGLYPKEAQAMVDTWSDSWFEEGARLLYIVPRQAVDAILPLSIDPGPADVARVFVGRMELTTPVTIRDVRLALAANDRDMLGKYGRFLQPIGDRILAEASPLDRPALAASLKSVASVYAVPASTCR